MLKGAYSSRVTRIGIPICSCFLFALIFFISAPLAQAALVDINTAGVEELDTLDGIGPAYAQRIIDYRTANGLFRTIEEIKNVSGIGESTFAKIKNSITVSAVGTRSQDTSVTNYSDTNSSHYSATPISNEVIESRATLSAGRDRTVIAGTPIEFRAETNQTTSKQNIFSWNFGDGTISGGQEISHTYEYPGEYVVVLSADFSNSEAVARVNVKVVEPELSITVANTDRIEITNNSKYEANLFGRAVVSGEKYFIFPKDTIIKAGQKVSFSSKVTGLSSPFSDVAILVLKEGSLTPDIRKQINKNKRAKINEISNNIAALERQIVAMETAINTNLSTEQISVLGSEKTDLDMGGNSSQAASVLQSEELKDSGSDSWFSVIKRFFLNIRQ